MAPTRSRPPSGDDGGSDNYHDHGDLPLPSRHGGRRARRQSALPRAALWLLTLALALVVASAAAKSTANAQQQHDPLEPLYRAPDALASHDSRALIPLAPDERSVPGQIQPGPGRAAGRDPAGGQRRSDAVRADAFASKPPRARSLQDWVVEDIVLLATVDGMIHATDRNTGQPLWHLIADKAMVETTYHPRNKSVDGKSETPIGDTDPGKAGENDFLWIVEPSRDGDLYGLTPGRSTGLQKLGLTVRQLVENFSAHASDDPPVVYTGEMSNTVYTVDIGSGKILGVFSPRHSNVNSQDVCRTLGELDALDDEKCGATGTLTITRTEYTVGITSQVTGEQISTIHFSEWGPNKRDQDLFDQYQSAKDNRYIHSRHNGQILALDSSGDGEDMPTPKFQHKFGSPVARVFDVARPLNSGAMDTPLVLLPQPLNPSFFYEENSNVFVNCTEAGSWYALSESAYPLVTRGALWSQWARQDYEPLPPPHKPDAGPPSFKDALVGIHSLSGDLDSPMMPLIGGGSLPPTLGGRPDIAVAKQNAGVPANPEVEQPHSIGLVQALVLLVCLGCAVWAGLWRGALPLKTASLFQKASQNALQQSEVRAVADAKVPVVQAEALEEAVPEPLLTPVVKFDTLEKTSSEERADEAKPKKKAHRGKRGGKRDVDKRVKSLDDDKPDAVEIKPDIVYKKAIPDSDTPVGLLNLEIRADQILGQGSGGTIVFAGKFEGRDVAVKRMLGQYSELASQEVSLLEQSEDHPNVIRYFCRRQDEHFLYIALELCQASLWDLFRDGRSEEVADAYGELVTDIRQRPDKVLRQLAEGLKHLHAFRIVHRDIKPQNMLLAYQKKHSASTFPRLVISDFGLCKTLPENASTLMGATISAGTTGWKAPELIFQPKEFSGDSNHSTSKDSVGDAGTAVAGVKRAVDIFSLGCVFFYVLTQGRHPFDDEEGWMGIRERNIKANRCNLGELDFRVPDDMVADTKDLIQWMLAPKPEDRPTAGEVLMHPFFWTKEDRLEFLSVASDRFDLEARDGSSPVLAALESHAESIIGRGPTKVAYSGGWDNGLPGEPNFLAKLDRSFIDTLGKQRKYQPNRLTDLLRALRNKHHHWDDMPDDVKKRVGTVPEGYLGYWQERFPGLVVGVWRVCRSEASLESDRRFGRWLREAHV